MGFTNPYPASRLTVDSTNSLVSGMVAWFPLTQGSGSVAQCILHPSHTGTLGSGVTWESSERGTVASFDGTSNARISLSSALVSGQTLSFSVWLYINTSTAARVQIYSSAYAGHVKNQFRFSPLFNNFTFDQYPPGGGGIDTPADTGVEGRWVHAVVTQDSSDTKIYYDGELKVTGTAETYSGSAPTVFDIGSDNGANSFDGKMQNFQAWDRVISADEVALLHARPWEGSNYGDIWPYSPPAASSMTLSTDTAATSIMADIEGWWVMTDGSGTTLTDISGNSRDATLYGTNTWENETLGTANRFDNSVSRTSHAETANTQPDLTGGYTFSTWVKHEELVQGGGNKYGAGIVLGNSLGSSDLEIYYRGNHTAQHPQVVHNRSNGGTNAHYYIDNNNFTDDNNVWVNFVVTHDGSTLKFYRDGVYQRSRSNFAAPSSTSGYKIYLNELPVGASNSGLTCSMQNTRLYSRALSDSEISLLHERPWEGIEYGDTFHHDPPAPASMLPLTSDAINTDQVGWWPLTETDDYASGAADISGGGNNGTPQSNAGSANTALGQVLEQPDANSYISVGDVSALKITGALSISIWLKTDSSTPVNIVSKYHATSGGRAYSLHLNRPELEFNINGTIVAQGTTQIRGDDKWHHLVGVYDPSNFVRVYVDGVLDGEVTTGVPSSITDTSYPFNIGRAWNGGNVVGFLQNCRVWDRVLTADEIWSIYANPWLGSNYKLASGSTPLYNYIFRTERFRRLG